MALGTISVVFISVLGSLTFLPGDLAILATAVNALRIPFLGRRARGGRRALGRLGHAGHAAAGRVLRRDAAILAALASPVTRLHLGQTDFTAFPD